MKKDDLPEFLIGEALREKCRTLAIAESCTGGYISHRISNIPGSSDYFKGGVVAYSNDIKTFLLYVSHKIIKKHGAVSSQVAKAMAKGAREALCADYAVSITGITGPAGGSPEKPVGLAYMAFASTEGVKTKKVQFEGNRQFLKSQFADAVLQLILNNI
ncbi:MAG: CinA family protein [Candidatus Omnitrophota bacterium]